MPPPPAAVSTPTSAAQPNKREPAEISPQVPPATPPGVGDLTEAQEQLRSKHYAKALAIAEALFEREPTEARLLAAYAKQHLKDHQGACALAETVLEIDPWRLDALLLLGNLARLRDEPAAAIRYYKQAIYHCPQCWEAHYLLAETLRRDGQIRGARREYQLLQRQLAANPQMSDLDYFRLTTSPQELARLVEAHLDRLSAVEVGGHGA